MITREEIEAKSEELEVHTANVQRDYVYNWLLAGIFTTPELRETLLLKGGNAFRKAYFPFTRFSNDLDFSTQTSIDPEWLATQLNQVCERIGAASGVDFRLDRNDVQLKKGFDRDKTVYEAKIYFQDFYGNADHIVISVKLDVTEYDKIYLPIQERNLIHQYSDSDRCTATIRVQKLEELLASKLICLLQRRHSLDLFDYVYALFLNRDIAINRTEVVTTFFRKTIFERNKGVAKGLLLGLPLDVFRTAWTRYLICPRESVVGFELAVANFQQSINELFGEFTAVLRGSGFFPSDLRNPIMQAADTGTLLRLTYDSRIREVEPYSLTFKTRQDGVGQEYFYAWDQSGGSSGKPGIRTFVSDKVQAIENTDILFEPRFPIELSRHAEAERAGYFARSFAGPRVTVARRSRIRAAFSGPVYVVQCNYCQRQFERKKRDTTIREHKDSYGNRCYGRRGYVVDVRYA
jgi:predicted nucleotidyltransferase component of viral defense system